MTGLLATRAAFERGVSMERNILSLRIGEKARISRIDGPALRERLKKMGLREGVAVERLGLPGLRGCVEIKIGQRRLTLGLGVAMKLRIEQGGQPVGLLDLSAGDCGVVSFIQGGQRIAQILRREFRIAPGTVVQMVGEKRDRDFLVEVEGKRSSLCEGDASKILVRKRRKIQLNYLKTGEEARIVVIAAGSRARSMLKEFGIDEGRIVRLVEITQSDFREPEVPLVISANDQKLSIGYGMAEKIWVEKRLQPEEAHPSRRE